jgi:purine nucleoside phosphorylase
MKYAAKHVKAIIGEADIAIVLGSGLGGLVDVLDDPKVIFRFKYIVNWLL